MQARKICATVYSSLLELVCYICLMKSSNLIRLRTFPGHAVQPPTEMLTYGIPKQVDGERLPLPAKDLGSCDLYPQTLSHNPNGRFVTVCGDGEYIIYTALAWRNKSFGTAEEFVWGEDSSVYATRCAAWQ